MSLSDRQFVDCDITDSGCNGDWMDLNDCVNDVQVNSLRYCSDQDEIIDTVSKSFIRVDMPLVTSSCSSVREMTCTGSGDTPSASPFRYTGLKLGEKVNSFNSEAGSFDISKDSTVSTANSVSDRKCESDRWPCESDPWTSQTPILTTICSATTRKGFRCQSCFQTISSMMCLYGTPF